MSSYPGEITPAAVTVSWELLHYSLSTEQLQDLSLDKINSILCLCGGLFMEKLVQRHILNVVAV